MFSCAEGRAGANLESRNRTIPRREFLVAACDNQFTADAKLVGGGGAKVEFADPSTMVLL